MRWWPAATGPSSAAASTSTRLTSVGSRGSSRPASARASSSRSPTRRRMRCEERSAELAASPRSPSRTSVSSSRLARIAGQRRAQLVRGVGHELALALQGALGLLARGLQRAEHVLQRAARARRPRRRRAAGGCVFDGSRVRSTSRAARGQSGDRAHRAAARAGPRRAAPAACRRGRRRRGRAGRAGSVASTSETLRAYWTYHRHDDAARWPSASTTSTGRLRTSTRRPPTSRAARAGDEAEVAARPACWSRMRPSGRSDRGSSALPARGEVAQVGPRRARTCPCGRRRRA